jgi:hypothetical protein
MSRHSKHVFSECDQLLGTGSSERPERLQIVDRFEQVGLPLSVRADDRHPLRRKGELLVPKVAKEPELE